MPVADLEGYIEVGRSALEAIAIAQQLAEKAEFTSILDMPCGHGRVTRWLRTAYPEAQLSVCDLLPDGVAFCARTFNATAILSTARPTPDMFPDRYDLIFVGSLLTHVDADAWDRLISLWHALLKPEGVLIVTTHGDRVAQRMRAGHLYGYPPSSVARLLRTYEHARFGFLEESADSIDYGITLAKPDWTLARLLRHAEFRVVLYSEALWHRHQDVAAVVKGHAAIELPERQSQASRPRSVRVPFFGTRKRR
jgi:SAM-dependent methyltransferase